MSKKSYKVKLDIFEGPLDLLLHLIKEEELAISEVSVLRVTQQYLEYLDTFKLLNIELASEFILVAANLMYLKSRALLPKSERPPEDESNEEDPRWDLIRQLIEYKKFKEAAGYLAEQETRQSKLYTATPERPAEVTSSPSELGEISIFELIRAFQRVLDRFQEPENLGDIVDDRYTVADKIEQVLTTIPAGQSLVFQKLFTNTSTKSEVIVTFLAILELMKMNQLRVCQDLLLGKISLERPKTLTSTDGSES